MAELTLDQKRADHAMKTVLDIKDKDFASDYSSYVKRLGASILMNGLGQTLAGEIASGADDAVHGSSAAHNRLAKNITSWLSREGGVYKNCKTAEEILKKMMQEPQEKYLVAQADIMKWLEWHKKFCTAFIARKKEKDNA